MRLHSVPRRLVGVSAAVAIAACAIPSMSAAHANTQARVASSKTVGWAAPIAADIVMKGIQTGMGDAATKLGLSVKTTDANLSPATQTSDLQSLLSQKAAGVAIWPLDPATVAAPFLQLKKAGIPVVTISSSGTNATSAVWSDEDWSCTPAKRTAQYIQSRHPGAQVLVVGGPTTVQAITHEVGCFEKQAKAVGLHVVEEQNDNGSSSSTAEPIVTTMLTQHPNAQAIFAFGDEDALGAGAAVQAAHKHTWNAKAHQGIIVAGEDGEPAAIAAIKSGQITLTTDIEPTQLGADAVELIYAKDHGMKIPARVILPTKLWDASNASKYVPYNKRSVSFTLLHSLHK